MRFARMHSRSALIVLAASAVMLLSNPNFASEQMGQINGTVRGPDDKPAIGLLIRLVKDQPRELPPAGDAPKAKPGPRITIIARVTTDDKGKFSLSNVPEGDYRLEGGNQNVGWLWLEVKVEGGKTLELHDLKLTKVVG